MSRRFKIKLSRDALQLEPAVPSQRPELIETDGVDPLLTVIEQAGYSAEFGCRQGFCGACRMTLLKGSVSYQSKPLAFVRDNEILPCCCRANSDLTLAEQG